MIVADERTEKREIRTVKKAEKAQQYILLFLLEFGSAHAALTLRPRANRGPHFRHIPDSVELP